MSRARIFDAADPLSKAMEEILAARTAVFITKDRQLLGLIDDRNVRLGISDPSRMKCGAASVRCPSLKENSEIRESLDAFLAGHFKVLPVLDAKGKIVGATSRSDLLRELVSRKLIPPMRLYQQMSRPACTIDYSRTVADAKKEMKRQGVHRLVVMRNGAVAGVITTFDFVGLFSKPRGRQSFQPITGVISADSRKIADILREEFASLPESATLEDAALKMAKGNISSLVVLDGNKPSGVISATDIFKAVKKLFEAERDVMVSGLGEGNLAYYGSIRDAILALSSKFEKSFKVENLAIHIKKGKSVYEANMHLELDNKPIAFRSEGHTLSDTMAAVTKELKTIFEKAKSEKMQRKKGEREEE